MMRPWLRALAFVFVLTGCSSGTDSPSVDASTASSVSALSVLARTFAQDESLSALLAAKTGFAAQDGALVSPILRADHPVLEGVGAELPARADGAHRISLGRSTRHGVSLRLVGAVSVPAQLIEGKTIYAGVFPHVDAVWAANDARAELFYVAHELGAEPLRLRLAVERGERIVRVTATGDGGAQFLDAKGEVVLNMPPPYALDAIGTRRAMPVVVDGDELRFTLDPKGLVAPVVIDPALEAWTWVKRAPSTPPDARRYAGMAFDGNRNKTVLFGGTGGGARCDTWEYSGGSWSNTIVAASAGVCPVAGSPPARQNLGIAYDGARKQVVVFGGYNAAYLDDTWIYAGGTTWTAACTSCVTGTSKPSGRGSPSMAFDSTRNVVVMFGGYDASGRLCDTWEWNGTAWSRKSDGSSCGTGKPAGRSFAGMAFDASRGVTVLFGGNGASGAFLGDTWEWNGTTWSQKSTTGPTARREHVLAYDPARARTVLFAGAVATGPGILEADTWEWNGTTWSSTTPSTKPDYRFGGSGAWDSTARRLVIYGGATTTLAAQSTGLNNNDTWEYHSYGGGCTLASQCDTGFCEDGVCCETACAACKKCDVTGSVGTCTTITSTEDTSGATCSGTSWCNASGSCVTKTAKGSSCTVTAGTSLECASGFCVGDTVGSAGVCCDTACTGGCQSCLAADTGGANGTCANVTVGSKRTGTGTTTLCGAATVASSCGNDGTCNGSGACRKWVSTTVCVAASCASATTEKRTSYCDGAGACLATAATACNPGFACVGTACKTSCTVDGDCASTHYCSSGTCVLKKDNGTTCVAGNECKTGQCPTQDKVCCDAACSGLCESCLGAKKGSGADGTCGAIASGGDPDSECPDPPAYACSSPGGMGVCDGAKKCLEFAKAGAPCAAGTTCTAGEQTGKACDGSGNCKSDTVTKCTPYKCDASSVACLAKCTADADCADAKLFFCDKLGLCQSRKVLGAECGDTNECAVGNTCVDKVCCNAACSGQCESCNEAGSVGTCIAVSGDPRTGHTACTGDKASGCVGTCDGKNRASCFYDVGKECDARCASNKATISKCDGTGLCKPEPEAACDGYKCTSDGKRCGTSCSTDDDCESTYRCDTTKCVPRVARCTDDGTGVDDGAGRISPCNPYKCRGAKCLESCTLTDDCVNGTICDGNKCVTPPSPAGGTGPGTTEDPGCGCTTPRSGANTKGLALGVLFIGLLIRRRARS